MKINIRGNKIKVTKAIKEYITEKINKLDKFFENPEDIKASVIISSKNNEQKIEVTLPTSKFVIRAEEANADLYAAVDLIIDKLERSIRKNKTKLIKHYQNAPAFEMDLDYESEEESDVKIAKRKNIETKPMDEDEALLQMQLVGHNFFAFKNIDEECVSIIYLRKDNSYGIINVK